jgi:ubiquinone/menaquinone biosynthesis C-methylase UbiE
MIEIARKNAEERGYDIDYRVGSSTELLYKSNEFDVVFTCLMYHHLNYEEKNQTLKEIHRIIKTGCRYVCLEFQEFPMDCFHRVFLRFYAGNSGVLHGLYPPELIEENGFYTEKEIKGPSFLKSHHTSYRVLTKNYIP